MELTYGLLTLAILGLCLNIGFYYLTKAPKK